jgi:hypothetical protein
MSVSNIVISVLVIDPIVFIPLFVLVLVPIRVVLRVGVVVARLDVPHLLAPLRQLLLGLRQLLSRALHLALRALQEFLHLSDRPLSAG